MDEGIIYEDASPQQIFENPQKPKTRAFIYKIKCWEYEISEVNFDSYQMLGSVEAFATRQFLPRKQIQRLRLILEELIAGRFIKAADRDDVDRTLLKLSFSCGENGIMPALKIDYSGLSKDPLSHEYDDDLRDAILERTAKIVSHDEAAKTISYELILQ